MKRRPQSAIIPKIQKDRSESGIQISSLIYQTKPNKPNYPQVLPPKEFFEDQEQLYISNLQLKQLNNELRYENSKLKAQIALQQVVMYSIQKYIFKIEKVDKYQQQHDPLGVVQSMDGSIVPILKAKVKEQKSLIDDLQIDLLSQQKSVKLTKLSELHRVIENQQHEILKLKQVIQSALNINDQDIVNDPNIVEKLSKFTITIHQQENTILQLTKQNDKLRKEYQEMSDDNSKLIEELKQLNFEKINYKKKLEEQTITESEVYNQQKREFLEKKLQATLKQLDTLKGELSLSENKTKQLTKNIKDLEKEFKQSSMDLQKQKQFFEEQCLKKDQIIQDLNDRINIVELLKQKSQSRLLDSPLLQSNPFFPPITFRDAMIQFPERNSDNLQDEINAEPIDENRLSILLQQLKFKIIKEKLTKERLSWCFQNKEYIQLADAIKIFMKSPFNFQENDSIILCRYMIGEDNGKSNKIQQEDTQEVKEIIHQLQNNPQIKSDYLSFQTILQWNNMIKSLNKMLQKCNFEMKLYNVDDFVLKLKNEYHFSYEQAESILLINYVYTEEIEFINSENVKQLIHQECAMLHSLHNLSYQSLAIFRQQPKKQIQKTNSDEDFDYQINSKNSKSLSQQCYFKESGFEKAEGPKQGIENKIQNIISSEQILTLSQFKSSDPQLKSSESRKPSHHNNNTSDLFQYSQSILPQATLKRPVECNTVVDHNIQFNITNQFQSPQINSKKMSPISEFQSGQMIIDPRNLNYNENETQITEIKKEDEDYEEIVEEYIEDL